MKFFRESAIGIINAKPFDLDAVYESQHQLASEGWQPNRIGLTPSVLVQIKVLADRQDLIELPERFMGMKVRIDPELNEGEWYIASESGRTIYKKDSMWPEQPNPLEEKK